MIKFGTDGWRALIDKDFTPENIEKVIQGFCNIKKNEPVKKVVLGFDRRNKSKESAQLVAEVLSANGFHVLLSNQFCPTPCVSWMVKVTDAFCGIMITASHNPYQWNGIKFKESYGGSASFEYTLEIEREVLKNPSIKKIDFSQAVAKNLVEYFDPHQNYIQQLKNLVDMNAIKNSGYKVLYDPIHGAGSYFLTELLTNKIVDEIRAEASLNFGGDNPEPISQNLEILLKQMKTGLWDLGLATDGDADRIGAVDGLGNFVNSHQIFALLLKHYVENKKLKGPVIKSISTTMMINKLCKKYGLECIETPIGFKHICKKLVETNALMGGEESGGISFNQHVHERDGLLNGLMLLEVMAFKKMSLHDLIKELYSEIGIHIFNRLDKHLDHKKIQELNETLPMLKIPQLGGKAVESTNFIDGFKYVFTDGSWLLIRASGTEPLIRIYAEASTLLDVQNLLKAGERLTENLSIAVG